MESISRLCMLLLSDVPASDHCWPRRMRYRVRVLDGRRHDR
jgi:hypothetical protein